MQALFESQQYCPYCGEQISLLVDSSQLEHQYTEDCEVCCRPILVSVCLDSGDDILVSVRTESQ